MIQYSKEMVPGWAKSWAATIAIGVAIYWYYSRNNNARSGSRGRSINRTTTTTTARGGPVQWSDSESTSKPSSKQAKAKAPRKSVKKAVQEVSDKVETSLSGASTTGADADDDLSPAVSPNLGATAAVKAPSGKDVSDMLEPKGNAASVLRIGASEKPARQNKQQQRSETPQETKKQRQNRKKAEEAKAQREADEQQRKILAEKQRRTAREARGEPARNGLKQAQGPTSNPWATARPSSGAGAAPASNGQLLDTFDPEVVSTTSSSEAGATNGIAPTATNTTNGTNFTNLPSEEEQMRMAMEDSESWETVPKNKKQRKNKVAADEGSDSGVPQEATPVQNAQPKPVENMKPQPISSRFAALSSEHDSDWPVV